MRLLVALLALVASAGWAEEARPVGAADLLARVSAAQGDKVQALLDNQQGRLGSCKAVVVRAPVILSMPGAVVFNSDGSVRSGEWTVRYAVEACGVKGMRTVGFQAAEKGIAMEALAPGDTLAGRALQADVVKSFALAARVAMSGCTGALDVRDTQIVWHPKDKNSPWREVWVGHICGRDLGQVIDFTPNLAGTKFRMSLPRTSGTTAGVGVK